MNRLPDHLRKYVVEQDYSRYTPQDQAVWRYTMRQLRNFLSQTAHSCYLDGLEKTGIDTEQIPRIEVINEKLNQFGWSAVPISGFIPPAAFMEFQSLGFLPIATDIRTIDHIHYTPAPDIVHESAGHAPILVDPEFAKYLKSYAAIATQAIFSVEDLQQYDAIRELSDLKEDPKSSTAQIKAAEAKLEKISKNMRYVSEAQLLSRMNWWTAEYGLIGNLQKPKLFGAGLLSSIGESKECLNPKVKKIPLSLDCINFTYDITEPQPQLFVTSDFNNLTRVLEELAEKMAYRLGGEVGLSRAYESHTVNTIELNSGLQISGVLVHFEYDPKNNIPLILQFAGPSQFSISRQELPRHSTKDHPIGFTIPLGPIVGSNRCPSTLSNEDFGKLGIREHQDVQFKYISGTEVSGHLEQIVRNKDRAIGLILTRAAVQRSGHKFHGESWGEVFLPLGSTIPSVFGGPADNRRFGERTHYSVKILPKKVFSAEEQRLFKSFEKVRLLRLGTASLDSKKSDLNTLVTSYFDQHENDWLLGLEIMELAHHFRIAEAEDRLKLHLINLSQKRPEVKQLIDDGFALINKAD